MTGALLPRPAVHPPAGTWSAGHGLSVRGMWFPVGAALLAGIVPVLLVLATPLSDASSPVWPGAAALTVVLGVRYAWVATHEDARLFELVFWLFTYVFLGLAPLVQLRSATYPATTPALAPDTFGPALGIVVVGTVAASAGLYAGGYRRRPPQRPAAPRRELDPRRVTALCTLALVFTAAYVARIGWGSLTVTRIERSAAESAAWPNMATFAVVKALATLPLMVCFVALMRVRNMRRRTGAQGPSVLPWLMFGVLALVLNPMSTPRYVVGTALLSVVVALGAARRGHRAALLGITLVAALVLVFPYADAGRKPEMQQENFSGGPAAALVSGDFDAFAQISNTLTYVGSEGHTHGRQLTGAALFWIPRAVWEDKPEDTGRVLADHRDYGFSNLSAPVWCELFMDGGWLLLVVGMGALGYGLRRLDERCVAAGGPSEASGTLWAILPFYLLIMLRGSLLQSMAGFTVLLVCGAFLEPRRRAGRPADRPADRRADTPRAPVPEPAG